LSCPQLKGSSSKAVVDAEEDVATAQSSSSLLLSSDGTKMVILVEFLYLGDELILAFATATDDIIFKTPMLFLVGKASWRMTEIVVRVSGIVWIACLLE